VAGDRPHPRAALLLGLAAERVDVREQLGEGLGHEVEGRLGVERPAGEEAQDLLVVLDVDLGEGGWILAGADERGSRSSLPESEEPTTHPGGILPHQ
jgi:hypothetical protein